MEPLEFIEEAGNSYHLQTHSSAPNTGLTKLVPPILIILRLTTDPVVSTQVQVLDVYLIHLLYQVVRNCVDLGWLGIPQCTSHRPGKAAAMAESANYNKIPTQKSVPAYRVLRNGHFYLRGAPVKAC